MGTKNNPGPCDCYTKAEPDEPLFTLLARDKHAAALVGFWAILREADGEKPATVQEAVIDAGAMARYFANLRGREAMHGPEAFAILKRFYEMTRRGVGRDDTERRKFTRIATQMSQEAEAAARNGYAVVKLSPRRSIVVKLSVGGYGAEAEYSFYLGCGEASSVAYGPSTHTHCVEWVLATIRQRLEADKAALAEMAINYPAAITAPPPSAHFVDEWILARQEWERIAAENHAAESIADTERQQGKEHDKLIQKNAEPPFANELGENGAG